MEGKGHIPPLQTFDLTPPAQTARNSIEIPSVIPGLQHNGQDHAIMRAFYTFFQREQK